MIRTYGPEILEYLYRKQHEIEKITHADWVALSVTWELKLKEIKKTLDKTQ